MLSKKAKYAIKTLIQLGKQQPGVFLSGGQISQLENIPKKSLEAVLLDLKKAEFIFNRKGAQGGYILTRPLEDILMLDIVRLTDGPIAQVSCASDFHYRRCEECLEEETCAIRDLYLAIRAADLKILGATSLAHMIQKEKALSAVGITF